MAFRYWILALAGGLLVSAPAAATEPIRVHGTADLSRAFGGHQQDELGFGATGFLAGELPLTPAFGFQLELAGVWLADGQPPDDPDLRDQGAASATILGLGARLRPWGGRDDQGALRPGSGLWLSAAPGITRTGDLTRFAFNGQVGWDFFLKQGSYGIGPTAGYLHVVQPDDQVRPSDAHIVLLGVHAVFDFGRYQQQAPKNLDTDGDGLLDDVDQCPLEPEDKDGFEDEDGCPDVDNDQDGILDVSDRCPDVAEDKDQFEDEDGCPDPDNDQDGILDQPDQCPNEAEDKDGFEDEDGCPDLDNDNDGIPDVEDLCPNEPETENGYADQDGCPDEEQVRVVGDKIVLDDRVHFRTNNAVIRPLSHPLLERLAKLLREHPEYVHIHIEGHADQRGSEQFNQRLSEDRAKSVMTFLVEHGIEEKRLSSEGFGSSRPRVDAKDPRAYYLNRRVEFLVTREVPEPARSKTPAEAGAEDESPPAEAGAAAVQPDASEDSDDKAVKDE